MLLELQDIVSGKKGYFNVQIKSLAKGVRYA